MSGTPPDDLTPPSRDLSNTKQGRVPIQRLDHFDNPPSAREEPNSFEGSGNGGQTLMHKQPK